VRPGIVRVIQGIVQVRPYPGRVAHVLRAGLLRHVPYPVKREALPVIGRVLRARAVGVRTARPLRFNKLVQAVVRVILAGGVPVRRVLVPQHVPHRVKPVAYVLESVPHFRAFGPYRRQPAPVRVVTVLRLHPAAVLDVLPLPVFVVPYVFHVRELRPDAGPGYFVYLPAGIVRVAYRLPVGVFYLLHLPQVVAFVLHRRGFRLPA